VLGLLLCLASATIMAGLFACAVVALL
jgi:hypothetical protein